MLVFTLRLINKLGFALLVLSPGVMRALLDLMACLDYTLTSVDIFLAWAVETCLAQDTLYD